MRRPSEAGASVNTSIGPTVLPRQVPTRRLRLRTCSEPDAILFGVLAESEGVVPPLLLLLFLFLSANYPSPNVTLND